MATFRLGVALRAALLGVATLLSLSGAAAAQSRVGVTSATDGDPLGKPPSEAERILKIGVDVQANEVVTTHGNDRAHLVFLDGSSLTVGPNAQLTIDKFVYDPNTKTGELAVTTTQGVFRLVGGKISKTTPITIKTPSSTIGIRGGITIFNVSQSRTVANFIFGNNMSVSGQGQTQNVTRPGSQVVTNAGAAPSPPTLLPPGGLTAVVSQLEGSSSSSSSSGSSGGGGTGSGGTGAGSGGAADQKVGTSGFSGANSQGGAAPPSPPAFVGGGSAGTLSNLVTGVVANTTPAANPSSSNFQKFTQPTTVTTQTQTGYTNGVVFGTNAGVTTARTPAIDNALPTDFTLKTTSGAGTNTTQAAIVVRGLDGTITSPNAMLQLGGTTGNSTFFNDSYYATSDVARAGTVGPVAGAPTTDSPLQHTSVLVSLATNQLAGTPVTPVIPQGTSCVCQYLTFGYWSSQIAYTGSYRTNQTDLVANAPYVAGTVGSQPVALPNTQTITYSGFMYGNVVNNGSFYNAAGTMSVNWNAASRAGGVVAGFDGMTLSGTLNAVGNTPNVQGSIQSVAGATGVSGPLTGSFFSGGGDASKYLAGSFGLTGNRYNAAGVFATQR